jgi:UDP-N-acetylglucosamine 1-carboxyvinyltransferase
MQQIVIRGGRPLEGTVRIGGAKNAALPIMAASLLVRGAVLLRGVPRLKDVDVMAGVLGNVGAIAEWVGQDELLLVPNAFSADPAPGELVRQMRGSICVLGPLLATRGQALLPLPGGCVIGERPIDLHLKGLAALGATIRVQRACIHARADRLRGASVNMAGPQGSTVLGTANVLMAAVMAEGRTVIEQAAREPEVQDLAHFLNACGARISGAGTRTLTVDGVRSLSGGEHALIPDRIEAGTYLVAGAITGGRVTVEGVRADHMRALLEALKKTGCDIAAGDGALTVSRSGPLRPTRFATASYPGVPTDMQPQLTALLCNAPGRSIVSEGVHLNRFTHTDGLRAMGARIALSGPCAFVDGGRGLHGAAVTAYDLRAGAALVLAGLAADGKTTIAGVDQLDRGYQALEQKLRQLGADAWRQEAEPEQYAAKKTA